MSLYPCVRPTQRQRPQSEVLADEVKIHFGDSDFAERLTKFLIYAQQVIDDANLCHERRLTIRSSLGKYIAIDTHEYDRETGAKLQSCSVWCFVAGEHTSTKALGVVKCGDILRPATWKKPAKHARGSVFDPHYGTMGSDGATPIRWTGPHYWNEKAHAPVLANLS